ncbi:MAG: HIRAN domain-containing protein [Prevotella sp.]
MNIGKDKCELLKNIRIYIAEKYGLDYLPSECKHESDCQGTCPKCDAELIDIQKQLDSKGITYISSDAVLSELFQAYLFSKDNNDDANSTSSVDPSSLSQDEDKHKRDSICLQGDIVSTPNEDSLDSLAREKNFIKSFVADKTLFMECPVAGIAFHDIDEIWDELEVGTKLALVRDKYNQYDKNAIAVALADDYEGVPDEFDFDCILGYIPRDKNQLLALFLDMGWQDMFETKISSLKRYGPYSERIYISIYIKHKEGCKDTRR